MNKSKTLIVGWDAADWEIIDQLMAKGEMPALKKLLNSGVRGNLGTLQPVLSPLLWTSIATGKRAHDHGILGFVQPDYITGEIMPIRSDSRKSKAFWNIFSEAGLKNLVVNWWPSYPVEEISGFMVSNQFCQWPEELQNWKMNPGNVYPIEGQEVIADMRMHPSEFTFAHLKPFFPQLDLSELESDPLVAQAAGILAKCASVHNAITHLLEEEDWDTAAVYYEAIDHFSHLAMKYHPPRLKGVSVKDFEKYHTVISAAYRFHDMMLERLIELAGPNCNIILLSDHGFQSGKLRSAQLPDLPAAPALEHRKYGVFCAAGPEFKSGLQIFGANLLDILPTLLHLHNLPVGHDLPGRVLTEAFAFNRPVGSIDSWENTAAKTIFMEGEAGPDESMLKELEALGYLKLPGQDKVKAVERELKYNRASSLNDGRDWQKALPLARELYHDDPGLRSASLLSDLYLRLGQLTDLKDHMNTWPQEVQEHPYGIFIEGSLNLQLGDFGTALALFRKIEDKGVESLQLYLEIASALLLSGKYTEAEDYFNRALNLQPQEPVALLGLAEVAVQNKDWSRAALYLEASVDLRFFQPQAHYLLALCFIAEGEHQSALKAVGTALSQAPRHKKARHLKEQLLPGKATAEAETLIVSGFPRSGTSMMMKVLQNGGVPIVTDNQREADMNNPEGYFEWEVTKNLAVSDKEFKKTSGKALKVVGSLVRYLPPDRKYRLIWMDRPLLEVLLSQDKMKRGASRTDSTKAARDFPFQLALNYQKEQQHLENWLDQQPHITWEKFDYHQFIAQPETAVAELNQFLDYRLDEKSAILAIKPQLYRNKIG